MSNKKESIQSGEGDGGLVEDQTPDRSQDFKITNVPTEKSKTPQRKCSKMGVLPKYPFSMVISGRSGSGKTVALLNILTKKSMFKDYFHYTAVFSPTAGQYDDTYNILKLPKENFIKDFNGETLENIIEGRKKLIDKHGITWVDKNSRVLLILDDIIASRQFLTSPEALTMFSLLRHYRVAIIVLIQSYNKVPRPLRIQANATIIFPSQRNEVEIIKDELCPTCLDKKQFQKVIEYATSEKHSFLYINNHCDKDKKIRKNLDDIIDLNKFSS